MHGWPISELWWWRLVRCSKYQLSHLIIGGSSWVTVVVKYLLKDWAVISTACDTSLERKSLYTEDWLLPFDDVTYAFYIDFVAFPLVFPFRKYFLENNPKIVKIESVSYPIKKNLWISQTFPSENFLPTISVMAKNNAPMSKYQMKKETDEQTSETRNPLNKDTEQIKFVSRRVLNLNTRQIPTFPFNEQQKTTTVKNKKNVGKN